MRNNYIVNILLGAAMVATACKNGPVKGTEGQKEKTSAPAKPSKDAATHKEETLSGAITALTKPVNARVIAAIPAIAPEAGTRIYSSVVQGVVNYDTRRQTSIASRVGGRIERLLVKYNYQPVKKGQLIMEIYSPDLAAAQRELLMLAGNNNTMLAGAKQRLQLLGMQPAQVEQVLRTGNILYRIPVYSNTNGYILEKTAAAAPQPAISAAPAGDGMGGMGAGAPASAAPAATPLLLREGQYVSAGQSLFTIYEGGNLVAEFSFPPALAAKVKRGQKLLFHLVTDRNDMQQGSIGLIEPVFRNGQNFTLARVYPRRSDLRAGQLLTAYVPVIYTTGWWLPEKAVWRLGQTSVVFRKEADAYVPVMVETGAAAEGMVQVNTPVAGWKIAANAAYLVDSESFIKTDHNVQQ